MNLKILFTAAALSAATFGATAHAVTYNNVYNLGTLGSHDSKSTSTNNEASGPNYDQFNFTLASPVSVFTTGAFTESTPFTITSADLTLYSSAGTELATTGNFDPDGGPSKTLVDRGIGAGDYYVVAETVVPNGSEGSYTLTATTISAAPEPSTWMFMIAGLAMIGGMLRLGRRNGWSLNAA